MPARCYAFVARVSYNLRVGGSLGEVRDFLSDLRRDLPYLFGPATRTRPRSVPVPVPSGHEAVFRARAEHWAPRLGVAFGRIRVKDQRTLWGSCSPSGDLSFNWRLTQAPAEVLDYVVVHELAHRLEMNHSRLFWAHVERVLPGHRVHRRWLRRHGRELQASPAPRA